MSNWIEARSYNEEKKYWDYVSLETFKKIDYNFMEDYPAIQVNRFIGQLFDEIEIKYYLEEGEMCINLSKNDLIKIFGAIMIKITANDEDLYDNVDVDKNSKYNRLYFYKALGNFVYICIKNDYKVSIG